MSRHNRKVLRRFYRNPHVERILGFANCKFYLSCLVPLLTCALLAAFAYYFPKLFKEYYQLLQDFADEDPHWEAAYRGAWAASSPNRGAGAQGPRPPREPRRRAPRAPVHQPQATQASGSSVHANVAGGRHAMPAEVRAGVRRSCRRRVSVAVEEDDGPALTWHHVDNMNKANGICPVFNVGRFDHTKGGHMAFPQLKIVVQFPSGTFILLPSATMVHGNVCLQEGETRDSITFFTAGGLFRWASYGFQKEADFQKNNPDGWAKEVKERQTRWKDAVNQFSTLESLNSDRQQLIR